MSQNIINIGYARVSTHKQDLGLEVQIEALKHCDQLFIERESGSNNARPELEKALKLACDLSKEGKQVTFTIYKLDRLTRSMFKLLELIEQFNDSDIQLVSLHEKLETDSLIGRLLCMILGFVAESELENLRFRTREGLRKAKEKGVKLGAKQISKEKEERIIELYLAGESSIRTIAKTERISTSTIYKVLERNDVANNRKKVSQISC
ncbi:recombinase family protein [Streptococcus australis]|uniref:Resolvase domain-containing protein n=1 Tax=Streptococcus australis TaxID=113107 RepID=A0A4V0BVJ3_9STRE|nr:recombinase family protein [Streptococcus australis]VTS71468.1 Resolvase domain-containing protein [Streptococcus australis]